MAIECSYELAKAMLELAKKEFKAINSYGNYVEAAPHIVNVVEYLAKALLYAIKAEDKKVCKKARQSHDVSELLVREYASCPIPLSEQEEKAIVGIALLNAMLCNSVVRSLTRYGAEPLGILFPKAARKSANILHEWKEVFEHIVKLLKKYYNVVERVVEKAGTWYIEVTEHSFVEHREGNRNVKRAMVVISRLRPTALYGHARVRIRLHDNLVDRTYRVRVVFKAERSGIAPVRCEVCLWDRQGKLANDDGMGSPKDYIYLAGGKGAVTVYAGRVDNKTIREIEPRVWKPGGIKEITVVIEEEIAHQS